MILPFYLNAFMLWLHMEQFDLGGHLLGIIGFQCIKTGDNIYTATYYLTVSVLSIHFVSRILLLQLYKRGAVHTTATNIKYSCLATFHDILLVNFSSYHRGSLRISHDY